MIDTLACGCERLVAPTFSVRSDEWRLDSEYAQRATALLDHHVGVAWRETMPVMAARLEGDRLYLEVRQSPPVVCGRDHARTFVQVTAARG